MTTSSISGHRQRTCRACGKKFDYPAKGSVATRHHCVVENTVELSNYSGILPR